MIKIFIGYDSREAVAFHTMSHSIWKHASQPVSIIPLMLNQLYDVHDRPRERFQSNDFTFSRWLVPYLCGYQGWAIFMDCDMLVRRDISELWGLRDPRYAVQVVKHNYAAPEVTKYLGNEQDNYPKKNWSSVMLMNCGSCRGLSPDYVNEAERLALHQFKWLSDDGLIGALPPVWNHLVGYGTECPDAAVAHFTIGGPYFREYRSVEFSDEWRQAYAETTRCDQINSDLT